MHVIEQSSEREAAFITVSNSSCGKVMFSQVCVKNSVHRGCMCGRGHALQGGENGTFVAGGMHGGHAWQGVCMAGWGVHGGGGMHGRGHDGGMHGRGHAWQGACMAGEHAWQGGGMRGRR